MSNYNTIHENNTKIVRYKDSSLGSRQQDQHSQKQLQVPRTQLRLLGLGGTCDCLFARRYQQYEKQR